MYGRLRRHAPVHSRSTDGVVGSTDKVADGVFFDVTAATKAAGCGLPVAVAGAVEATVPAVWNEKVPGLSLSGVVAPAGGTGEGANPATAPGSRARVARHGRDSVRTL